VRRLIEWFAANGVAANLLMLLLIVMGVLTLVGIKQEVFPEFSADLVTVRVPYPGAAPEEVEEGVVIRIEEKIQDLPEIKEIRSTAAENMGTVLIEAVDGSDLQKLLNDVKSRVDSIDTFPVEAEEPIVEAAVIRRQVMDVAISGDTDERSLKRLGERVRDDLAALPGISQVELSATRPYEISIEVSETALRRWGLTFQQVADAVRRSSLDLPGGKVETSGGEVLLRTEGQAYVGPDFEELPLVTLADGSRIRVGDVATVVDGFAETETWSRFDGVPAVLVQVFRVGDQSALDIEKIVNDYLEQARKGVPEGIALTVWDDRTEILRSRLDLLIRNGRNGFLLVVLVLALFLKLRLAAWVSLGIPISFLGAIALMPTLDVSISLISLFAFIVVLGVVVDDAIIVGENIYSNFQHGKAGLRAAVDGATEVSKPVFIAILTTVAAFAPLLGVTGNIGKIMRVIPLIVIPTLLFSLVESLLILPNHLSHMHHLPEKSPRFAIGRYWNRLQDFLAKGLERMIDRLYRPTLKVAIEWRYLTLACMIFLLLLTAGVVRSGWLQFNFMPDVEGDNTAAYLALPQGTPASSTVVVLQELEDAAKELAEELDSEFGGEPIRHVMTTVGQQPFRNAAGPAALNITADGASGNLGEVNLELVSAEERRISSSEIANRWREKVGAIPDAEELTYSSSLFASGEAINLELSGPDVNALKDVAIVLGQELASYPGVRDISDTFRAGKRQIQLNVTTEAEAAGVSKADLARQVRQAFYGEEVQRILRGRDEIKVMVRFPADQRSSLGDLENLRFRTPTGVEIPFSTAATMESTRGPASIQRKDRRRVVNVTADVDEQVGNANEIIADLQANVLPDLMADHPGVRYSLAGEQEDQKETLVGLAKGFFIALFAIYGLLAIAFRSYLQPVIVMSAIPFGLIGAIWGHIAMGLNLTILSMFGIVALTGVVVNDSLVMVDFINRAFRRDHRLAEAIRRAGSSRFRPILLTSLTTFAGLTPLLLEKSLQAQFLIPMAVSLAFGVLFATLITLILVPSLYSILEDLRRSFAKILGRDTDPAMDDTAIGAPAYPD
jgi:multidrug efflux pump subunit AcrB